MSWSERKTSINLPTTHGSPHLPPGGNLVMLKPKEAPRGAIYLSDDQVIKIHQQMMEKYRPAADMYSLKYGGIICAGFASLTGLVFVSLLRPKFRLGTMGFWATYLPTLVLPSVTTLLSRYTLVEREVVLNKTNCPLCYEARALSLQVGTAYVQPLVLSVLGCAVVSKSFATSPMPHWNDVGGSLRMLGKIMRPLTPSVATWLALNSVVALVITAKQYRAAERLRYRMATAHPPQQDVTVPESQ